MRSLGLRIIFLFRIRSGYRSSLKRGVIRISIICIITIILGLKKKPKTYLDSHLSLAAGCAAHRPLSAYLHLRVAGTKIVQLLLLITQGQDQNNIA